MMVDARPSAVKDAIFWPALMAYKWRLRAAL
jgi:hypothetical protein